MRVLEVTHYMPPHSGGIERVAHALCDGLGARGHEVRWIASATPERPGPGDGGARTRVRAWNGLEERLGVPYPLWSPGALGDLRRLVRWADVVHVHDCLYMGSAAAVALAGAAKRPVLLSQHVGYVPFGAALDRVQELAYRTLGAWVLARADKRVACSAHVPDYFAQLGACADFTLVPNAVDIGRFGVPTAAARRAARTAWGVADDARVLLFVGRLVPKKGVALLAPLGRALAGEGVTLVVVGDGPLAPLLDGVPGLVHHPRVAPERMPELYALADAFVLPSRGEGLPLSVQEAMMTGLPLLVSDDAAYRSNLAGAPGVALAGDEPALIAGARAVLASHPPREAIAGWARARWNETRFVDAYERLLGELTIAPAARVR